MSANAYFTVLAVLAMALCVSAQPVPLAKVVAQDATSGSVLLAFVDATTDTLTINVTMGACTGLQIHMHNETELLLASPSNPGAILVAFVDGNNTVQSQMVPPGGLFALPTAFIHYQYNQNCAPATFTSTLKMDASTQLVLGALYSIPPTDYSTYAMMPASQPQSGFFATNSTCMSACAAAAAGRK